MAKNLIKTKLLLFTLFLVLLSSVSFARVGFKEPTIINNDFNTFNYNVVVNTSILTNGTVPVASDNNTLIDSVIIQDSSGGVGIGTSNPYSSFQVHGTGITSSSTGVTSIVRADRTDGLIAALGAGVSGTYFAFDETGSFNIGSTNRTTIQSTSMTLDSRLYILGDSGNVGINTKTPAYKLDVAGSMRTSGDLILTNAGNGAINADQTASYTDTSGIALWDFKTTGSSTGFAIGRFRIWDTDAWGNGEDDGSVLQLIHSGTVDPLCDDCTVLDIIEGDTDESAILVRQTVGGTPFFKVKPTGAVTATTLNTGQGDYELYAMNQNVQTTDTPSFDAVNILGGSQDILIDSRSNFLTIQGQTSASSGGLELYTADGDGTDKLFFQFFGVGTPEDTINMERLSFIWNTDTSEYEIYSEADGTGTLRPFQLYTEGNTNQLYLETDGFVGIGTASPTHKLHVVGDTNITETLTVQTINTTQVNIDNDCGIQGTVLMTERATIVSNQLMAFGNGDAVHGAPQLCSGVVKNIACACENGDAVNHVDIQLVINNVGQTCDTGEINQTNTMFTAPTCDVSFTTGQRLNTKTKTETGAVTGCVCSIYVRYD